MSQLRVIALESVRAACQGCLLAHCCLPEGLVLEEIVRLDEIAKRTRLLHRGDYLFQTGDRFRALYIVKTGVVKRFAASTAGEQVVGFHLPGDVLGFDGINHQRHDCSTMALETAALCEIPFARLEVLAREVPRLQHQIYCVLSRVISGETEMLLLLGKKNAEERLAVFLVNLSQRLQRRGLSPSDFYLSMSRHDIGSYLGLAVETISRLLMRFQEDRLLRVERKHIQLLNLPALTALGHGTGATRRQQHQR
ncbi:transcriptional regulator FNR [Chromatium okenii]|uniref:fumarate/nitrate reduction transcriptional regulator Fnr n=1 Tax=Chromatium okenii TaxID=61644 RepID=UPI001904B425|nr:transcriptional regulator FNR [Chromatium okenii]